MTSDQLVRVLKALKQKGSLPAEFKALQMSQSGARSAEHLVKPEVVQELRNEVAEKLDLFLGIGRSAPSKAYCLTGTHSRDLLDVRLCLPVSKATAKQKRLARFSHGLSMGMDYWRTLEYFENVAWPNYARVYGYLFKHGDVEVR